MLIRQIMWPGSIAAVSLAAIVVAGAWVSDTALRAPAPGPAQVRSMPQDTSRFGPGVLYVASTEPAHPLGPVAADSWVPSGLTVTPDQHLEINKELRLVFDYFLQPQRAGDRSDRLAALHDYLRRTLPEPASIEAEILAQRYVVYLQAVDAFKASDIGSDDAVLQERLRQMSRLRQTMLGARLAASWFADEEAGMRRLLERRGHLPGLTLAGSAQ